jgi:osmotically-inducible protein OsmY
VRSSLRRDGRTAGMNIQVSCDGGRVTLAGVVDTQRQAGAAAEVVAASDGVRDVDNQLKSADSVGSRYRREA